MFLPLLMFIFLKPNVSPLRNELHGVASQITEEWNNIPLYPETPPLDPRKFCIFLSKVT